MLGILVLDTAFPRIAGDVGCVDTFDFPVRHALVRGAGVEGVVHAPDAALVPRFIAAARDLQAQGCIAITTTCGFLAAWQGEIAAELDVPVMTSALLQVPLVQQCLAPGRKVGIVTYDATALTPALLQGAGMDSATPIAGVDPHGYFAQTIRFGAATLDRERMAADVIAAARALLTAHAGIGAVVLECANMPPYGAAVARAIERPVFDAVDVIRWFYAGVRRVRLRDDDRDLW
jgi:hypothetical protein